MSPPAEVDARIAGARIDTSVSMPGIFLSYRREDSAGHAGRLYDRLRARLGPSHVFMDISGIEAGVDFMDAIEAALGSCSALLVVIGPDWLTCTGADGRARLADPADVIRLEISAALARKVRVIPVLVGGARLPGAEALPEELKSLARRQVVELRDTRWDDDTNHLVDVLAPLLAADGGRPERVAAGPSPGRKSYRAAALVAVAVLVVALAWWIGPRWSGREAATDAAAPAVPAAQPPAPDRTSAAAPLPLPKPADGVRAQGAGVAPESAARPSAAPSSALRVAPPKALPSARLVVLYLDDADRTVARDLLDALRPLGSSSVYGRRRPGNSERGEVVYAAEALEPTAAAIADKAGAWLTERYGRPITLSSRRESGIDYDAVLVRLPRRQTGD